MANNYFTPENSWKHLFYIIGLTADEFYTDGGLKLNIEQLTWLELKNSGYERIVFYDKNNKLYCYDDDSFALLTVDGKTRDKPNMQPSSALMRSHRGLSRGRHGRVIGNAQDTPLNSQNSAPAQNSRQPGVQWTTGTKSGIQIRQILDGPLHMGMRNNTFVERQINAYMHDEKIKTAIVINDPTDFATEFGRDPMHALTAEYERMGTDNENIMVFLYTDIQLANFYQVNQFEESSKDANIIYIACPNVLEVKNMLMHLRINNGLNLRMSDLNDAAISLRQAMSLSEKPLRIKEVYLRFKALSSKNVLKPDDCFKVGGVKKPQSAKEQLEQMIGMQSVKTALANYETGNKPSTDNMKYLTSSRLQPDLPAPNKKEEMIHFVLTGNPGTGKTTVARLIGQLFYEMGYLESGHVVEVDREKLVGQYIGETAIKTREQIEQAMGGVLFVDEAYSLKRDPNDNRDFGQEAIDTLLKSMDQDKGKFIVVAAGYPREMELFMNSNPGLQRRFTEKIQIDDYTPDEMRQIVLLHARLNSFMFSEELGAKLPDFCENWVNTADENWGNAGEAVRLIEQMGRNWKKDPQAKSGEQDGKTVGILEERHVPQGLAQNLRPVEELRKEALNRLNAMTGLEGVKRTVEKLRRRMLSGDMKEPGHYLFVGNPGTGKTTVARIMGQILRNLGLLKRGHLVEYTASNLMAEVFNRDNNGDFGAIAKKAMGGVLFIDEAYELQKDTTGRGAPILAALLPFMENNRKDICIILAGYENEIDDLLRTNPGFSGRFTETILFENYTGAELCSILLEMLDDKGITYDEGFKENALRALTRYVEKHGRDADFANARYVRSVFLPGTLDAQNNRLIEQYGEDFDREMKKTLTAQDIPADLVRFTKTPLPKPDTRSAYEKLDDLIGYDQIKEELRRLLNSAKFDRENEMGVMNMPERLHWVLEGNPGTGKTTIAKLIGQVYKECGILPNGKTLKVTRSDLVGEYVGETAQKTRRCIRRAMGGVLFIDEAYSLTKGEGRGANASYGTEAVNELVEAMEDLNGEFAVICAGYPSDMEEFLRSNEGLKSRMKKFVLEDYKPAELVAIFEKKCREQKVVLDENLQAKMEVFFANKKKRTRGSWGNGREAENLLRDMLQLWHDHPLYTENKELRLLTEAHIPAEQRRFLKGKIKKEEKETSAMEDIDNLIGFDDIKERLRDLIALKKTADELDREEMIEDLNFHWVLRGNPGTGKTTIAKLIGKVYKELGLLSRGHTVKVTRKDLVSEHVGGTAPKTQECIDRAMGGVLFIDEAYSLIEGSMGGDTYGQEAINTLLEQMSDLNGEFAVICAGYPREMAQFLNSNSGLESRFGENFLIKDYTAEEITRIFEMKCREKNFLVDEETRNLLQNIFARMIKSNLRGWANGREAENLEKRMRTNWAKHPVQKTDPQTGEKIAYYTKDHIPQSYLQYLSVKTSPPKPADQPSPKTDWQPVKAETMIREDQLAADNEDYNYEKMYLEQVKSVVFIRALTNGQGASGSGSIISKDGHILTCNHVIEGQRDIRVRIQQERDGNTETVWEEAELVWRDANIDAAILKINRTDFQPLPLRKSDGVTKTGESIYLWGYPFGGRMSDNLNDLQPSLFQGYISSIQVKNGLERINTNMEAKSGCSGGPVFSKVDGSIIGILCGSMTVGREKLVEEINYVLPVKYLFGAVIE